MPLLANDEHWHLFAQSLDRAIDGQSCRLLAYVFMPERVHILTQPTTPNFRVDLLLKAMKAPFSARIKKLLEASNSPLLEELTVRERPGVYRFRFWQEGGGYDRNLRSKPAILAAIDYIHENPVRRSLCEKGTDWRWSSARYYQEDGSAEHEKPPTIHGVSWDLLAELWD